MIQDAPHLPELPLHLSDGRQVRLSDYAGQWLVLYFYPRDNTPGCTREAGDFRDLSADFERAGAVILGVSRDSLKSHQSFIARHNLPFALVCDSDEALCRAFGVIKEKTLYGRKVLGIERSTFLIDPAQRVVQSWRGVKVPGHAAAVLAHLHSLSVRTDPSP